MSIPLLKELKKLVKENILSNNLFDGKLLADKSHNKTGVISISGISTNENYIAVKEGKSISISNNNTVLICNMFFYNSLYEYVSNAIGVSTAEVPTGATYMAFNFATADLGSTTKIMVNYGTKAMTYEPYVNAVADLKENRNTEYLNFKLSDSIYGTFLKKLEVGGIYEVSIVKNYNTNGDPSYRGVIYGILSLPCGYSYNSDGTGKVVVRPKFNIISNYNGMNITEDTSVKVVCDGGTTEIDINTFKAAPQVYIYHSNSTYLKIEKVNIRKITI